MYAYDKNVCVKGEYKCVREPERIMACMALHNREHKTKRELRINLRLI